MFCVYYVGFNIKLRDMIMTVYSDLNGASPKFTLNCISTGGPATTVIWTRDSTTVTEGNETVLNDPATALYTHTLTVTGRLPGRYRCTVKNNKPSTKSKYFIVQGMSLAICICNACCRSSAASAPSNLKLVIINNSTFLTWTPPSPLGDTTGYRISFTGGSSGSVNVSGGSTDNFTLTRFNSDEMYNISIVGTSEHFFSESVAWDGITLKS